MVLDNRVFVWGQRSAEYVGRLIDDRAVGRDVDHAVEVMGQSVIEREGKAGECLAAACGHGHGEYARRLGGNRHDRKALSTSNPVSSLAIALTCSE